MTRAHNGPNNLPVKHTMIKPTVGHVRKEAYDLPSTKNANHIYGYEVQRDEEGTGSLLGKWVTTVPSKTALSSRSYVATNKLALQSGCVTAKETREFANKKMVRIKAVTLDHNVYVPPGNVTYGIQSAPSEDVTRLIQGQHMVHSSAQEDYPDLSTMHIKGKLPLPRETKSSTLKDVRQMQKSQNKEAFKMKKFSKVQSVMSTQPKKKREAPQDVSVE